MAESLRRPAIAGNWKMHHGPDDARAFFEGFLAATTGEEAGAVVLFPPAISLAAAREAAAARPGIRLGVQNVHWEEKGAFTGEISAGMARQAGAEVVLVGHSERRHVFGETDAETARKVRAVLDAGLLPMLCVGETLEQRDAGREVEVVREQLEAVTRALRPGDVERLSVAYEPVWAIGTGRTAAASDASEMHGQIRAMLAVSYGDAAAARVPILYGGSVKPANAAELLAAADIDGVLVGGASLDPESFAEICRAAP